MIEAYLWACLILFAACSVIYLDILANEKGPLSGP